MRLFVAVPLSEEVKQAIVSEQKRIGEHRSGARSFLRWVKYDQLHLTMVFLGEVPEEKTPLVIETIGRDVAMRPFGLTFGGLGVFPPHGAPRVVWIGVTSGAPEAIALQREIADRVTHLGVPLEARPFQPHLTLGRWRDSRPADRRHVLALNTNAAIARARVDSAVLYQSRLSSAGPTYTALARANLIGN